MTAHYTIRTINLPEFARNAVGFDRMFADLERVFNSPKENNYPPYNLVKLGGDRFVIEVAVAGFRKDEIEIEVHDSVLTISGERRVNDDREFLHKGISSRDFERKIALAEYVEVRGAKIEDGILTVELERVVPEGQKPKRIAIAD